MNICVAPTNGHFAGCTTSSASNRGVLPIRGSSSVAAAGAAALSPTALTEGEEWLVCPRHRRRVAGRGWFNPLAPVDREGVLDERWKSARRIDRMMSDVRQRLGNTVADYFWDGCYTTNLFAPFLGAEGRVAERKSKLDGSKAPLV